MERGGGGGDVLYEDGGFFFWFSTCHTSPPPKSTTATMATDILMLHYNDVYNAEPLPPPAGTPAGSKAYIAAGATRFAGK